MTKRLLVKKNGVIVSALTREISADGIITVGSEPSSLVALDDQNIALEQFVIVCEADRKTLMSRADGTLVNGENLPQGAMRELQTGDVITVGDYEIALAAEDEKARAPSESPENIEKVEDLSDQNQQPSAASDFSKEKPEGNLKDILESLRSEEKFYFQVDEAGRKYRVYIENEEMWLGWTESGECLFAGENEGIAVPRAQIRKDWTGVLLYPAQAGDIWLNDQPLLEARRLKNDDRISLLSEKDSQPSAKPVIKFHEPTALLVLDSILPKELPPPVSLDEREKSSPNEEVETSDDANLHSSQIPAVTLKGAAKNLIFGYFTVGEIAIMAIGTLITAAMIFLILELY